MGGIVEVEVHDACIEYKSQCSRFLLHEKDAQTAALSVRNGPAHHAAHVELVEEIRVHSGPTHEGRVRVWCLHHTLPQAALGVSRRT